MGFPKRAFRGVFIEENAHGGRGVAPHPQGKCSRRDEAAPKMGHEPIVVSRDCMLLAMGMYLTVDALREEPGVLISLKLETEVIHEQVDDRRGVEGQDLRDE